MLRGMFRLRSPYTAAKAVGGRAMSTRALTFEQALTSNHLILSELQSPAVITQLKSVSGLTDTLNKWQQSNALLMHTTMRILPQVGFTADAAGLHGYSEAFADCLRTSDSQEAQTVLQDLNDSKWRVLLEHAFGCEPSPPISLTKAREIAIDMVDALQDPKLMRQMEDAKTGLAARLPENEKQHMVARALVSVQEEVVVKHGYMGSSGYAQAQVCLMRHSGDAVVTASIAAATTNLYARAGINLQQALMQATGQR